VANPTTDPMGEIHFVGFGSQARAWAQCLKASGWKTTVFLHRLEGPSFEAATEQALQPRLLRDLGASLTKAYAANPTEPPLVALLLPDSIIGSIYREFLASLEIPLTLVLAHGYAVYAQDLQPARAEHAVTLFAPKAIGPKIWSHYQQAQGGGSHRLVAGVHAPATRMPRLHALGRAMLFSERNLIEVEMEKEAVGDLISEQGLLCGGVFTLLDWTVQAMREAGVPAALIHEECITELELIAGLLRERGPAATFSAISQAAQCGTVLMRESLEKSDARRHFDARLKEVTSREFTHRFESGQWKPSAARLLERLRQIEKELGK
jgi:ketol-acid reductoisomerase